MIEQNTVDEMLSAISDGEWSKTVGYILLAMVAFARFMTRDRFEKLVANWISASASLVLGVAVGLAAGGQWLHALLLGVFASPTSHGFWELVRSLLPKRTSE